MNADYELWAVNRGTVDCGLWIVNRANVVNEVRYERLRLMSQSWMTQCYKVAGRSVDAKVSHCN